MKNSRKTKQTTATPAGDVKKLRILLAEDSADMRFVVKSFLNKASYEVHSVEDGEKALTSFKEFSYDLVLMDLEMPVMDGYTATREIRKYERDEGLDPTPVLALTAHALKEHTDRSREAGCDLHISKPVKGSYLLKIISEQVK